MSNQPNEKDQTSYNPFQQDERTGLDIQYYLYLFLRRWYWLALGLAAGLTLAWIQLRYATTIYQVSGTVLIAEQEQSSISQEQIIEELGFSRESDIDNELQVLRSSGLMKNVVDSLGIHVTYFLEGNVKTSEQYDPKQLHLTYYDPPEKAYGKVLRVFVQDPTSFSLLRGDTDTLQFKFGTPFNLGEVTYQIDLNDPNSVGNIFQVHINNPMGIARGYAGALQLAKIGRSEVISMTLLDPAPLKAQEILSTLVKAYNQSIIEQKNSSGKRTLTFIDERLKFITEELDQVEEQVEGFREQNELPIAIPERAAAYLDQIKDADEQLMELDLRDEIIQRIENFVRQDTNQYKALPIASEVLEGTLASLVKQYNDQIFQREQMLEAATAANPTVATFDEQLGYLRTTIRQSVGIMRAELADRRKQVQERLRPLERQISSIPSNERRLLQIMRQQQIKEQLFLYLFKKREETALSIAAQVPDARVLDAPINRGPVSPSQNRVYLFAIIAGLLLPGGIIFLRDFFDNKVYSRQDIQKATKAPFLGMIAASKKEEKFVVKRGSRSGIAEMFRLLRTNLNYLAPQKEGGKVMMVTSSISGEGKTFISINLGLTLALAGKKTILLGFDLRKPKLSQYISGNPSGLGISTYLVGEAEIDDLVQPVEGYENIHFIGSGAIPPNPSELILSDKTAELLDQLKQQYDYILIDTAPLGLVTDAFLMGEHADQCIIAVRHAVTNKGFLQLVEETYQAKRLPNLGIVLNGVKANGRYGGYGGYGAYGGYGGYGGYSYGYGYGYYEDDQKKPWWRFGKR